MIDGVRFTKSLLRIDFDARRITKNKIYGRISAKELHFVALSIVLCVYHLCCFASSVTKTACIDLHWSYSGIDIYESDAYCILVNMLVAFSYMI